MADKIVVVVYPGDLPQFKLMAYCLNKNWQDDRNLTIVYQGDLGSIIESIVNITFSKAWNIEIKQGINTTLMDGYQEQQLHKVIESIDERYEDVIVFDCKDFLLKPANFLLFKQGNLHYFSQISQSDKRSYYDYYPTVVDGLDLDSSIQVKPPLILTPWIWNVEQLKRYWQFITNKFGSDYNTWTDYPTGSEWASYYLFTSVDSDAVISFDTKNLFMPIGGMWDNNTQKESMIHVENFNRTPQTVFWKHHRRLIDPMYTSITAMQLQNYNIPMDIISQWVDEKYKLGSDRMAEIPI